MNLQALRDSVNRKDYQVCEPLTPDEKEALKASIAEHGITVPVAVDEDYRIIDGYHRMEIFFALADEGFDVSVPELQVLEGMSDREKWEEAYRRNYLRRQMTAEQKQAKAVALCREGLSNEQIAATIGVSLSQAERYTAKERNQQKQQRDQLIRQLASEGKSNREIARELGISKDTVRNALGGEKSAFADFSPEGEGAVGSDDELTQDDAESTASPGDDDEGIDPDEDKRESCWNACYVCRHNIEVKVDGEYRGICAATQTNLDTYIEIDHTGYPPCYDADADTLAQFQMPATEDTVAWDDVKDELLAEEDATPAKPHVANNSGNNEWYTPEQYITAARSTMGGIDLDPATSATANTVVQASAIYTAEDDGLSQPWSGRVWMNPPYSADLIGKFVDKLTTGLHTGDVEQAVVIVNNATETAWFQQLVLFADAVCFPRSRVRFWSPDGTPGAPLQGQAVIYAGPDTDSFARNFRSFGYIVLPWINHD